MDVDQDAYGQLVVDYYRSNRLGDIRELVERDDGYIALSNGPASYFSSYDNWLDIEKEAIQVAKGRVLDVGCGPGRVCLYLQEQGNDPVGIDDSPLSIAIAQERGVADARLMSITDVSAETVGHFDTIVMFGNNFGLLGNPVRARELLRRFYLMTPEDGLIIAESNDVHQTAETVHKEFHELNRKRGRLPGQLRLRVRYKKIIGPWFDYLMVSPQEMAEILQGTGWKIKDFFEAKESGVYVANIEKE